MQFRSLSGPLFRHNVEGEQALLIVFFVFFRPRSKKQETDRKEVKVVYLSEA